MPCFARFSFATIAAGATANPIRSPGARIFEKVPT